MFLEFFILDFYSVVCSGKLEKNTSRAGTNPKVRFMGASPLPGSSYSLMKQPARRGFPAEQRGGWFSVSNKADLR